jgi:aspartyl/asparaginyl beta-hydroxylase (cupin superfamily)
MAWMLLGAAFAALALGVVHLKRRVDALPSKTKKRFLKQHVNSVFEFFERRGWLLPEPAFDLGYHERFPALAKLEAGHAAVREECLALLEKKHRLTDMSALGGTYTQAGIHTARWKVFLFKSGDFVPENCARCPRTASLLRDIPDVYTAFFSILDPHETIPPHWGYYKGFLRYHLGVIVPNDNADLRCFLRVNPDPRANRARDAAAIEKGEVYFWHEGEGIVFDDNYLHDARNGSDAVRVVLWIDLARPMPLPLALLNRLLLWLAYRERSLGRFRENALVAD